MNYWLNKYARLMLDHEIIHADDGLQAVSLQKTDNRSRRVFTTNFQIWF